MADCCVSWLEHNCDWSDLRMAALEFCEKEQLAEKEQLWINKLCPSYMGFNQIDSITLQWELRNQPQRNRELALREAELFGQYMDYGYSALNYLHAFANNPHNPCKDELDQRAAGHISGPLTEEGPKTLMDKFFVLSEEYEKEYALAKPVIEERYAPVIHKIFERCKIKSKARENEIIALMVNYDPNKGKSCFHMIDTAKL